MGLPCCGYDQLLQTKNYFVTTTRIRREYKPTFMDHLLCAKLAVLASPTADIFLSICYVPSSSEV